MELILTKFDDKRQLRLLLRHNCTISIKYSSLYKINKVYYVLLSSLNQLTFPLHLKVNKIDKLNAILENYVYNWAKSELLQEAEFIKFEHQTQLKDNARVATVQGAEISRTFEQLADVAAILNYTTNSFSDGGKYNNIDSAVNRVKIHLENKARIIDLGVEASSYNVNNMSNTQEIATLKEIVPEIINLKKEYKFGLSIDTYHYETVKWLLDKEIDIINDVSGKLPAQLVKSITDSDKQYIAMHSLTIPVRSDVVFEIDCNPAIHIYQWMEAKIREFQEENINLDQVILDPGIGFGLLLPQSWYVTRHLSQFRKLPCELMLGHSRKIFFSHIYNELPQDRDLATAVIARDNMYNVDYLRLHDLKIFNYIAALKA